MFFSEQFCAFHYVLCGVEQTGFLMYFHTADFPHLLPLIMFFVHISASPIWDARNGCREEMQEWKDSIHQMGYLQKGPNADLPQCGRFKSRLGILFCMTLLRALLDNSLPVLGVISDFSVWHKEN